MLALLVSVVAASLSAAPSPSGYVVRVDASSVYLDIAAGSGAAVGRRFEVYAEGEELKHPVSGKSLGRVEKTIASGRIVEVRDAYSVGRLDAAATVAAGQRARLVGAEPAPAAPAAQPRDPAASKQPRWKSPVFDLVAVAMAVGELDGSAGLDLALADSKNVHVRSEERRVGKECRSRWSPYQ